MKNGITTTVISALFLMSLYFAAHPGNLEAQPSDCGYGERHCLTREECVDYGGGWMDPITKWLFGLVLNACYEYHYYYR